MQYALKIIFNILFISLNNKLLFNGNLDQTIILKLTTTEKNQKYILFNFLNVNIIFMVINLLKSDSYQQVL